MLEMFLTLLMLLSIGMGAISLYFSFSVSKTELIDVVLIWFLVILDLFLVIGFLYLGHYLTSLLWSLTFLLELRNLSMVRYSYKFDKKNV